MLNFLFLKLSWKWQHSISARTELQSKGFLLSRNFGFNVWKFNHSKKHVRKFMEDYWAWITYFLELEVQRIRGGSFINWHKYTHDVIAQAWLQKTTPVDNTLELNVKYNKDVGNPLSDLTVYRKLIGSLVYLTITRLDISQAVNIESLFTNQPTGWGWGWDTSEPSPNWLLQTIYNNIVISYLSNCP